MGFYIISFAVNMLIGLLFCINEDGKFDFNLLNNNTKRKKIYLVLTALQFGLLCGFRSISVGYDTGAYKDIFNMCSKNWKHILDKNSYIEIGFTAMCSIIKLLGGDFQIMLIITSLFVMGSCCLFLYRHSKNILFSVFIIISFPYFYSSFDIIRHFIATSFILLGYKYIEDRKFWKYFFFVLLGGLFQTGAWLFLPFYYINKIKWNGILYSGVGVFTIILHIFIEPISNFIIKLIGKSYDADSGWIGSYGGGIKTAAMYGVILIIAMVAFYQIKEKNEQDNVALSYVILMFLSSVLFINARLMTRLIMSLTAFVAISIPQLLDKMRMRSAKDCFILRLAMISIGCVYHIFMLTSNWQNVVPYIPFWR